MEGSGRALQAGREAAITMAAGWQQLCVFTALLVANKAAMAAMAAPRRAPTTPTALYKMCIKFWNRFVSGPSLALTLRALVYIPTRAVSLRRSECNTQRRGRQSRAGPAGECKGRPHGQAGRPTPFKHAEFYDRFGTRLGFNSVMDQQLRVRSCPYRKTTDTYPGDTH